LNSPSTRISVEHLGNSGKSGGLSPFPRGAFGLGLFLLLLGVAPALATIGVAYQMLLGNPSNATTDTNDHNPFLIQREVQALDYSDSLRQPNWAGWNLTIDDTGDSRRSPDFFVATTLPTNFYWVQTTDYVGSGYDRGHMCPSPPRSRERWPRS